jgi:hypothetical protein
LRNSTGVAQQPADYLVLTERIDVLLQLERLTTRWET